MLVNMTEIPARLSIVALSFFLSVSPPRPGFVLCEVQVSQSSSGNLLGSLTAVVRLVSTELGVQLKVLNPLVFENNGLMDRFLTVRLETDQSLEKCAPHFLTLPSCRLKRVSQLFSHPFTTICDFELDCPSSGIQMILVSRYAIQSLGGASNAQEVMLEVPYEKSRPSVTLLDVTETTYAFSFDTISSLQPTSSTPTAPPFSSTSSTYQRSLLAVFSHDVSALLITAIVCEDCLVLRQQRLNTRLVLFDIVPSRNTVPSVTMRCLIPENSVSDAAGTFNVRSAPLSLSIPTGPLILYFQTMPPISHNTTLNFHLITSEPFSHFIAEDLIVRNGYVVSLDSVAHPLREASSLFMYEILVKATAEGSVCVDLPKGTLQFVFLSLGAVITHISRTHNPETLSSCCSYDSLFPYLVSSSPTSHNLPHPVLWVVFELSEPLLLLCNPLLPFTENLELFTVERLLSAVCAPGLSGQCISITNAQVLQGAVASNRIAFQLNATSDGTVSVHIPKELITDWAGNGLKEDVTKTINVNTSPIRIQSTQMIAFSRSSYKPEVLLRFSIEVEIVENTTQSVCTYDLIKLNSYCVTPHNVIIKGNLVRVEIDSIFVAPNSYSVEIPPGFFHDKYWNYFEGVRRNALCISSRILQIINVLHMANQMWLSFAVFYFAVGSFIIIAG